MSTGGGLVGLPSQKWLTNVQLHLSIGDFLEVFGLSFKDSPHHQRLFDDYTQSLGYHLTNIADLKRLGLRFREPARDIPASRGCRGSLVDWVLTMALPYVADIPTVTLTGAIKNASKIKWNTMI